jgi:hypothetical protein
LFNRSKFNRARFNRKSASGAYAETVEFGVTCVVSEAAGQTVPSFGINVTSAPQAVEAAFFIAPLSITVDGSVATTNAMAMATIAVDAVNSISSPGLSWAVGTISFSVTSSVSTSDILTVLVPSITSVSSVSVDNFAWVYKDMLIGASGAISEALGWSISIADVTAQVAFEEPTAILGLAVPQIIVDSSVVVEAVGHYSETIEFSVESAVVAGSSFSDTILFEVTTVPTISLALSSTIEATVIITVAESAELTIPPILLAVDSSVVVTTRFSSIFAASVVSAVTEAEVSGVSIAFGVTSSLSVTPIFVWSESISAEVDSTLFFSDEKLVTFAGVVLKNPSKLAIKYSVITTDTVLATGEHSIQTTDEYGVEAVVECFGIEEDVDAILAVRGVKGTLITLESSITNCYLTGGIKVEESDGPGYFKYTVTIVKETV